MICVRMHLYRNKRLSLTHWIMSKQDVIWIRQFFDRRQHSMAKFFFLHFRRCVTNKRPLIESGTMGPKGHTFVVVPYQSESYSNQVKLPLYSSKNPLLLINRTIQSIKMFHIVMLNRFLQILNIAPYGLERK